MAAKQQIIAFQGELGAYSHQACREVFPLSEVLPCNSFEGAIKAVQEKRADLAMLPVENSTYGRVPDIHRLLPDSGLHIIGEHFVRVHIALMAAEGVQLADLKKAISHPVLLPQCRSFLEKHKLEPVIGIDTAGSAKALAEEGSKDTGALAAPLAAEIYNLNILANEIEDQSYNTTRFLVISPDASLPAIQEDAIKTTFVFRVRNIPAALYKALGGFATNGVNMVKLESYMLDGSFTATQFYADVIGHPDEPGLKLALDELGYFTDHLEILGVYPSARNIV